MAEVLAFPRFPQLAKAMRDGQEFKLEEALVFVNIDCPCQGCREFWAARARGESEPRGFV